MKTEKNEPDLIGLLCKFFAFALVLAGIGAGVLGLMVLFCSKEGISLGSLSSLGSYFQIVAACWGLAGFFMIYATFRAQYAQMKIQAEQMQMQRQELEDEKIRFRENIKNIQIQNFENSFFELMNLLRQITGELLEETEYTTRGRECFKKWHSQLVKFTGEEYIRKRMLDSLRKPETQADANPELSFAISVFQKFYDLRQDKFGHYFRILYHLVKLVEHSAVLKTFEDKKPYVTLVRAQLSAYELVLLYYNGILPEAEKFKPWLIKYDFFKHLDKELVLSRTHHQFYMPEILK